MDENIVTEIITKSYYLTTATCVNNRPWIAPTIFWIDNELNFYIVSHIGSRHVQDIQINSKVAISIYDSTQPEGTGKGVQFGGYGTVIANDELKSAIEWLWKQRLSMSELELTAFILDRIKVWSDNNRVVVKIRVDDEGMFLNKWDGKDYRVPVKISADIKLVEFNRK